VPASAQLTRHFLALLSADVLLLRQLGASGLTFQLAAVVDYGVASPHVLQELRGWLGHEGSAGEARLAG
jgi:hypothetical protein